MFYFTVSMLYSIGMTTDCEVRPPMVCLGTWGSTGVFCILCSKYWWYCRRKRLGFMIPGTCSMLIQSIRGWSSSLGDCWTERHRLSPPFHLRDILFPPGIVLKSREPGCPPLPVYGLRAKVLVSTLRWVDQRKLGDQWAAMQS